MFKRCVLPLSLGLTIVSPSNSFRQRCYGELYERDQQMHAFYKSCLSGESIRTAMESAELSLAEEQRTLEELKKEMQDRAEQGNWPLSKKQRRLQYVNELLSHNSDLKKQSLIKVINNLNKCGVECTLSTQGKGSHITLSVDGKKHTISSKMQMTHLKDALSDSGVQFSVIENDNGQSESDQIILDQTLKVDQLTQLLSSLGVNLAELEKERLNLAQELERHEDSVEELSESLVFNEAANQAADVIIHRSFGRREMIWQIYEAVLADLPHFGSELDFRRAVKKRLMSEKEKWGRDFGTCILINQCSTIALQRRLFYFESLATIIDAMPLIVHIIPSYILFSTINIDIMALDLREFMDAPEYFDWSRLRNAQESFVKEHQRHPYLEEFKAIMNGLRWNKDQLTDLKPYPNFEIIKKILSDFERSMRVREKKHEEIMQFTELNPNDDEWYQQMTRQLTSPKHISSDDLMKISELYDRCNCKMAQAWFDLAVSTLERIWQSDHARAADYIEKMLKQTPFQNKNENSLVSFGRHRRACAVQMYNEEMDRLSLIHQSKKFSEVSFAVIERAERIYGDGLFKEVFFLDNCLQISLFCMEIGDLERAARYYARVPDSIAKEFGLEDGSGFNPKSKEVSRERRKWENAVREQERRMRKERVRELVILAKAEIRIAKETWDKRDELDLDTIEHNHQQLRKVMNEMKDCLECAIDHPDLLRQLKDKDELYQKCVAFKKGEHSPKKKKTQKKGKRGKH